MSKIEKLKQLSKEWDEENNEIFDLLEELSEVYNDKYAKDMIENFLISFKDKLNRTKAVKNTLIGLKGIINKQN